MDAVGCWNAYAASAGFLFLRERSPFWAFVHHLLVEDQAAVAADGFSRIVIVNEVFAPTLWALIYQALLGSLGFFAQVLSVQ